MSENAGGVALEVVLNYDKARASLADFKKQLAEMEDQSAAVSKILDGMKAVSTAQAETLAGAQAMAIEYEEATKRANDLADAKKKEADATSKSSREQAAATAAQIKDAEYINKTLDQRQKILSRISAALKGQSVESLSAPQQKTLAGKYSNLALTEYSQGGLVDASNAKAAIANNSASAAAQKAQAAAAKEAAAEESRYYASMAAMDDKYTRLATAEWNIMAASKVRGLQLVADAQAGVLAEMAAADEAYAAEQAALMKEEAAAAINAQKVKADAAKLAAAEQIEAARQVAAVEAEQAAATRARSAAAAADAKFETSSVQSRLRVMEQIAQAEKNSVSQGAGTITQNKGLASQFPAAAVQQFSNGGLATTTAEFQKMEASANQAAKGIKATAQEAREVVTIGKDIGTGEWARFAGSFTRLLTISGAFDGILGLVEAGLIGVGAAVLGVGVAMLKGEQEETQFNASLALTNDYAGTTRDGLMQLAQAATASGGSMGQAKDAVLELANSGKYTSDQIGLISKTAVDLNATVGTAVDATIKQFERLSDDPSKYIVTLNDQYHFLTESVYDQIVALQEQGDKTDAARIAIGAYAQAMETASGNVRNNQGFIEKGWDAIKSATMGAISAALAWGQTSAVTDQIADLQHKKALSTSPGRNLPFSNDDELKLESLMAQQQRSVSTAQQKMVDDQKNGAEIAAKSWYNSFNKEFFSPAQKREKEIADYMKATQALRDKGEITPADTARDIQNINNKYKDKKTPRGHIDPTQYDVAANDAKLAADALKVANDQLAVQKALGVAVTQTTYSQIEGLQVRVEDTAYTENIEKINKQIQDAERNHNAGTLQELTAQKTLVTQQHTEKLAQLEIDYEEQTVLREIASAQANINSVIAARSSILSSITALYGTTAGYDQNALDNATERAEIAKAQSAYAQQEQDFIKNDTDAGTAALVRQQESLTLAQQIYAIEQDRTKLLGDNAKSLQDIYQATYDSIQKQVTALDASRKTLSDNVAGGFTSGSNAANNALFQSFKSPATAKKFTLQNYTGNIGGGIYDSITSQLSKDMTESTLKSFQSLLKLGGASDPAETARAQAQADLAVNTQKMTDALGVTIPQKLDQLIGYASGTLTPTGPVGNAALSGAQSGTNGPSTSPSAQTGSGAPLGFGSSSGANSASGQISSATDSLKDLGSTSQNVFQQLGISSTQASSLLYTGIVAATSGGKVAFKNFVVYATEQLLELYAVQKLVGLAGSLIGGAAGSENAGASATSTPDDLITSYGQPAGHADGVGYVTGPGGSRDDKIPARLSHGEGVLNAPAVSWLGGKDAVDALNKKQRPRGFANGGVVSPSRASSAAGGSSSAMAFSMDVNVQGGSTTGQAGSATQAAQSGQLQTELEQAVLQVFAKYSAPGGAIYNTVKKLTK